MKINFNGNEYFFEENKNYYFFLKNGSSIQIDKILSKNIENYLKKYLKYEEHKLHSFISEDRYEDISKIVVRYFNHNEK